MKVIIPVAGIGSRLRPHTHSIPKVLINVAGKSIIEYLVDSIKKAGLKKFVFIIGYLGDEVRSFLLKKYPELNIDFAEQTERKGLADAVYLAKNLIGKNEPLLIVLGDSIFKTDFKKLKESKTSSIGVVTVKDPSRFGVIIKDGRYVTDLIEKPDKPVSNIAISGIYLIKNSLYLFEAIEELFKKNIKTKGEFQLTDALKMMLKKGEKISYFFVDKWLDCGLPEDLLNTNREILQENKRKFNPEIKGSIVIPPVYIHPNSKIKNSVIGPNVSISKKAVIEDSIIKNSIVSESGTVKSMLLEASIIGSNASISGIFNKLNIGDSSEINWQSR